MTSRTWLITGSSRGLGRVLAEAALEEGERVVATARDPRRLDDLVARFPERARAVALDVTDRAQADAAVRAAVDAFGRIDVLVNNAGYANIGAIEDLSDDDFRAQIETNLWGVINVTRAALPQLRAQGAGHVIQIGSSGGRVTAPGAGPYQTAKWAVEGFSGVLAKEVAPLGITVTVIEPGGMRTDWAGASMTIHAVSEPYRQTVGVMGDHLEGAADAFRSDPAKAAQAIIAISREPQPPLQLLLGSDAYTLVRAADEARIASDVRWKELTFSTDADDAVDDTARIREAIGQQA